MPNDYLVPAALHRPWTAWAAIGLSLPFVAAMRALGVEPAVGLAVLFVGPNPGGYLVAAGLIGHAVWDIVHYWASRVAARTYAEFCAVFDILVGAAILFMM